MVTKEQKRQLIELGKETEILLDDYTAEFSAGGDRVVIFDEKFNQISVSYAEFERILLKDGRFYSGKK